MATYEELVNEFVPEAAKTNGLVMLTRKERYTCLIEDVSSAKEKLQSADTAETISSAITELNNLLENLGKDRQIKEDTRVHAWIADAAGVARAVKMHDAVRSSLYELLDSLLEAAKEIVEQESEKEKEKERVQKLRNLFSALAEHAEEVAKIIDTKKIFADE